MCKKLKNYVKYGIIKVVTRCGKYLKIIIKGKYKGKAFMQVSVNKELDMLERELHECENLPEELLNGEVIANTVKYYAKKFIDKN